MRKLLKRLITIIITFILLLVIAGFGVAHYANSKINSEEYRNKVIAAVHAQTGRDLVITGPIELSFFPALGVHVNKVQLSNAKGFEPENFASIGQVDIRVKLLPLISHEIKVGKIILKDLTLNLSKNKQGLNNWQDLENIDLSKEAADKATEDTTIQTAKKKDSSQPSGSQQSTLLPADTAGEAKTKDFMLSIGGVSIENANILWTDLQKGQTFALKNAEIKSASMVMGGAFPLHAAFDVNATSPNIVGHLTVDSDISFAEKSNYQLKKLRVVFAPKKTDMAKLSLQVEQILVDLPNQTLQVSNGVLASSDLRVKWDLQAQQILTKPTYKGSLETTLFDLKKLLQMAGKSIVTTDPKALQKVSLQTQFSGTASSIALDALKLHLDDATIEGQLAVTNFATPALRFNLKIDQLNVDHYLPAASGSSLSAPVAAGATSSSTKQQSSLLREANMNGSLYVGKAIVSQVVLNQLSAEMALNHGLLKIDPLNVGIYKGNARGKIAIDFQGSAPKYTIDEVLSNIDMTQLVKSGKVVGKANVTAHLTLHGADKTAMMKSLNGNAQFSVQEGALLGKNLPYEVERAIALFKRQPMPAAPPAGEQDRTRFDTLKGTALFAAGILNNNDLLIQSPQFKATGNGSINLAAEVLNYHLRLVGLHTLKDAQGKTSQEERQTPIPVAISGTFDKPVVMPDVKALLQSEVGKKAMEQVQEKLGPEAGKAVEGILQMLQK